MHLIESVSPNTAFGHYLVRCATSSLEAKDQVGSISPVSYPPFHSHLFIPMSVQPWKKNFQYKCTFWEVTLISSNSANRKFPHIIHFCSSSVASNTCTTKMSAVQSSRPSIQGQSASFVNCSEKQVSLFLCIPDFTSNR